MVQWTSALEDNLGVESVMSRRNIWLGQRVIGFIDYEELQEGVYLKWTHIEPEHRLQGHWRKTVLGLIDEAATKGKRVFIDFVDKTTELSPTDYVTTDFSRRFYEGLGFREMFRYGSENERVRLATQLAEDLRGEVVMPAGAQLLLIEDVASEEPEPASES